MQKICYIILLSIPDSFSSKISYAAVSITVSVVVVVGAIIQLWGPLNSSYASGDK